MGRERLVYLSRHYTTHDWNFLAQLGASRYETYYMRLGSDGTHFERRPLPPGVREVDWPGRDVPAAGSRLLDLVPSFERAAARLKPKAIHAGPVTSAAFLAAVSGRVPFVAMSWGSDVLWDMARDPFEGWAGAFALRKAARIFCDCRAARDRARALTGRPAGDFIMFPWGVDLERFSPGPDPLGLRSRPGWEGATVVLSTRSWEPIYGTTTIVEAFARAAAREPRLRLVLLGGGSLASKVSRVIARARLEDRVLRPGAVPHADLPAWFRAADLYVSASLSDGTSVSLLEAFASGVPAAVTDLPSNREWVRPGETGALSPAGDAAALARVMLLAARRPERTRAWAAGARRVARRRADWSRNFKTLLDAYGRL